MRRRCRIALAVIGGLSLFAGIAGAYIHATIAHYEQAPPCDRLSGIPGLLQKANLISSGTCEVQAGIGTCRTPASLCTVQVLVRNPNPTGPPYILRNKQGTCQNTVEGCACVPR